MKKLANALRKVRESKELTQIQAAEKAKMSVNYYRLIESGNPAYVSEKVAVRLISKLGAPRAILGMLDDQKREAYRDARKRAEKRPAARKAQGRPKVRKGGVLAAAKASLKKARAA